MMAVTQLRVLGGAMARVPVEATAFAHRRSRIMANVAALYAQPEEKVIHEAWTEQFTAASGKATAALTPIFWATRARSGYGPLTLAQPGNDWQRLRRSMTRPTCFTLTRISVRQGTAVSDAVKCQEAKKAKIEQKAGKLKPACHQ